MAAISAVTFDLWQTLLMDSGDLGRSRAQLRIDGTREALSEVGREYSDEPVREAYGACYHTCRAIREQLRDVSFQEQVEIFIGNVEEGLLQRLPGATVKRIVAIYADSFFAYPPPPHQDAKGVLEAVRGRGYALGLISNTGMTPGVTFRAYMDRLGLLRFFDTLVFSDEVLLAKPSRDIFLRAATALQVLPQRIVHVGDHLVNDVLGAKQVGMKTIWIETPYEGPAPPEVTPDVTVKDLAEVTQAIETLNDTPA